MPATMIGQAERESLCLPGRTRAALGLDGKLRQQEAVADLEQWSHVIGA